MQNMGTFLRPQCIKHGVTHVTACSMVVIILLPHLSIKPLPIHIHHCGGFLQLIDNHLPDIYSWIGLQLHATLNTVIAHPITISLFNARAGCQTTLVWQVRLTIIQMHQWCFSNICVWADVYFSARNKITITSKFITFLSSWGLISSNCPTPAYWHYHIMHTCVKLCS